MFKLQGWWFSYREHLEVDRHHQLLVKNLSAELQKNRKYQEMGLKLSCVFPDYKEYLTCYMASSVSGKDKRNLTL